jgi:hypothetical protein
MTLTEKFRKFIQDKQEQASIREENARKDHHIQAIRLQMMDERMRVSK